jgi:predicted nucleotidyltransferase component of viral defense system
MRKRVKNIAASVRARLLKIAKDSDRDFNAVLLQYFQERLLFRLSISYYKFNFVLKGALLFLIYNMSRFRTTKDIDFLGIDTSNEQDDLLEIMREVAAIHVDDGVQYDVASMKSEIIKEDADYHGVRIYCEAQLEQAKKRFHFDIGFGDIVVPNPINLDFPTLLTDMPAPKLKAYTPESAIAEKFEAIVKLGYFTSRMKDFYDIHYMAHHYEFKSEILRQALNATFKNRETDIADRVKIFTEDFSNDTTNNIQWKAFLKKNNLELDLNFSNCLAFIRNFIEPLFEDVSKQLSWDTKSLQWCKLR